MSLSLWIGLYREVPCETNKARRESSWIDNSAYIFKNWSPQEPDTFTSCIMMSAEGQWEDTDCNEQLHYVCEKPAGKYLIRFIVYIDCDKRLHYVCERQAGKYLVRFIA